MSDCGKQSMDVAIAVFDLSKAGGLERHALRLADELTGRGHTTTIYTTASASTQSASCRVATSIIPRRGFTNHGRMAAFGADLQAAANRHDLLVGFQKLPGLDALFCCDWSHADRKLHPMERLLPRHRTLLWLEGQCCGPQSDTLLMMLAEPQAAAYRRAWAPAPSRMLVLPPTLDAGRVFDPPSASERKSWRESLGIASDRIAWFWLGLQPAVKGLDRVIEALALSPSAHLVIAGADPDQKRVWLQKKRADQLGCGDRVTMVGRLEDKAVKLHFRNSDLMVHPARLDVTGTVIVEALAAGLPVVTTRNCGYSVHVEASGAGRVVPAAATPRDIAAAAAAPVDVRARWSADARSYVARADLTSGIGRAADEIERLYASRARAA